MSRSTGAGWPRRWNRSSGDVVLSYPFGAGLVVETPPDAEHGLRTFMAEEWPTVRVLATGLNLRVLKDTGRPLRDLLPVRRRRLGGVPRGWPTPGWRRSPR